MNDNHNPCIFDEDIFYILLSSITPSFQIEYLYIYKKNECWLEFYAQSNGEVG